MSFEIPIMVIKDTTKTNAATEITPSSSTPSYLSADKTPPKNNPLGKPGFPEAAANELSVKKPIIVMPNIPPTRCPGNRPMGSENHLDFDSRFETKK